MAIGVLIEPGDVTAEISTTRSVGNPINAAIALMDALLDGEGLAAPLLHSIQLYLAAHFVAIADPLVSEESYAGARFRYEVGKTGEGLASTRFGRTAIALDITGKLARAGEKNATMETF